MSEKRWYVTSGYYLCTNNAITGDPVIYAQYHNLAPLCDIADQLNSADALRAERDALQTKLSSIRDTLTVIASGGCLDPAGWADLHLSAPASNSDEQQSADAPVKCLCINCGHTQWCEAGELTDCEGCGFCINPDEDEYDSE